HGPRRQDGGGGDGLRVPGPVRPSVTRRPGLVRDPSRAEAGGRGDAAARARGGEDWGDDAHRRAGPAEDGGTRVPQRFRAPEADPRGLAGAEGLEPPTYGFGDARSFAQPSRLSAPRATARAKDAGTRRVPRSAGGG